MIRFPLWNLTYPNMNAHGRLWRTLEDIEHDSVVAMILIVQQSKTT